MADPMEGGSKEFQAFLKGSPSVDDAARAQTTIVTGMVFRSGDGKFALTGSDGQTLELPADAVEKFRVIDASGAHPVAELHIHSDKFKSASILQFKPFIKDVSTDLIKDILADQTFRAKDISTDPVKDLISDQGTIKAKDVGTDGVFDPVNTFFNDPGGGNTGVADTLVEGPGTFAEGGGTFAEGGGFDPGQIFTNPAVQQAGAAGMTPFVMATPHHAPAHLLAMQAGIQQPGAAAGGKQLTAETGKELSSDTIKEPQFDTLKEIHQDTMKEIPFDGTLKEISKDPSWDTLKEISHDTRKEMSWDTWIEGGPFTRQEGTFDPGGIATQPPVWNFPGSMF